MTFTQASTASAVQAVIFDWAGTVIDFGSQAPMGAFVELFRRHGVDIEIREARIPMGLPKWHHIQELGQLPRVAAAWQQVHGRPFTDDDVDQLYAEFTPMNRASVVRHSVLVPGAVDVVHGLRERGIAVASTTGYNRDIMEVVMPLAQAQGFDPALVVCAGDLAASRPSPVGVQHIMSHLGLVDPRRVVKVDDTVPGLLEGRNAGCWVVAVLASGNALGLTEAQWAALDSAQRDEMRREARRQLEAGQADFHIDTVADLPQVIDAIESRIGASAVQA